MARMAISAPLVRFWWLCALITGFTLSVWAAGEVPAVPVPTKSALVQLKIAEVDRPIVPFVLTGSLQRVLGGQISPWDFTQLNLSGMDAAFGVGTVGKDNAAGEMFSFAGRTFIRSTNPKTGVELVEVPKDFRVAFSAAVPANVVYGTEVVFPRVQRINFAQPRLLQAMLEEYANATQYPIGVLGWVQMPEVEGVALKRAPINDEGIFGSKKDDYLETLRARDANVVFFAVVLPSTLQRPSLNAYLVSRAAFAETPKGPEGGTVAPAAAVNIHGALVNEAIPNDWETRALIMPGLQKVTVKDILQIHGFSSVQRGALFIYRLKLAEEYTKDETPMKPLQLAPCK
ncbi:MAG: hypothetical protein ACYDBB_24615 [Armatimonadota bacterium]